MRTDLLHEATSLKHGLRAGAKQIMSGWMALPSLPIAEAMASRFEAVTVDLQHGLLDTEGAFSLLPALTGANCVPLCRVPVIEPGAVGKLLDAGYLGIIAPMVETAGQAEALVAATSYPPSGTRSYGPLKARRVYGGEYGAQANEAIIRIAMIETVSGIESLDSILSVDDIDGIYVGPADLALSMGLPPQLDTESAEVAEAMDLIGRRAREAGKFVGLQCATGGAAGTYFARGFSFIGLGSDLALLELAMDAQLRDARTR